MGTRVKELLGITRRLNTLLGITRRLNTLLGITRRLSTRRWRRGCFLYFFLLLDYSTGTLPYSGRLFKKGSGNFSAPV